MSIDVCSFFFSSMLEQAEEATQFYLKSFLSRFNSWECQLMFCKKNKRGWKWPFRKDEMDLFHMMSLLTWQKKGFTSILFGFFLSSVCCLFQARTWLVCKCYWRQGIFEWGIDSWTCPWSWHCVSGMLEGEIADFNKCSLKPLLVWKKSQKWVRWH